MDAFHCLDVKFSSESRRGTKGALMELSIYTAFRKLPLGLLTFEGLSVNKQVKFGTIKLQVMC